MAFGYQQLYANGLNNNTQLRRSADMIYQRGANYNIILTGDTYEDSMEMDVDLYSDGTKVGRMQLVPYDVTLIGPAYYYSFNLRPYDYMSNYIESQHFQYYWQNDWNATNNTININNQYPNKITANFKYGYRYINSSGNTVTEYTGSPSNNLNHFTDIPFCITTTGFSPQYFTNTGEYFDYVGGAFQMVSDKFIFPNLDQEIGTTIDTGLTLNNTSIYRRLSPMSQYLMDYPTLPEMSETARFLTDAPRIQYIQSDENYILYYLNGQSGDRQVIEADYVVMKFYDSQNNNISAYTINQQINLSGTTYASPTGYTDTLKPFALPCGPKDIDNIFTNGYNWDSIAYYTVQLCYAYPTWSVFRRVTSISSLGPISETFYFYLYNNCQPENTRIAFLNTKGGYDYFTFKSYRQDTKKIKTQQYDNRYFSTDMSGPDFNVGRSVKTFGTDLDQEIVLESDYLSVPVAQWLEQLFYSPQVYEVKPNFISPIDRQDKIYWDLRPLQILSTEVDTITKKHRKLNKYRITLKSADTFFVNRGF